MCLCVCPNEKIFNEKIFLKAAIRVSQRRNVDVGAVRQERKVVTHELRNPCGKQ